MTNKFQNAIFHSGYKLNTLLDIMQVDRYLYYVGAKRRKDALESLEPAGKNLNLPKKYISECYENIYYLNLLPYLIQFLWNCYANKKKQLNTILY